MRCKCERGHGARRNGNYFRNRIWFSDVFSFSAGIVRRTAVRRSSQKFSFPNPTAKTSHLGPIRVRRTEFFGEIRFTYDIAVPCRQLGWSRLWVATDLRRRENQKKKLNIFRKFQHFINYRRNSDKISSKPEHKSVKRIQK